jgi:hypothetical protein
MFDDELFKSYAAKSLHSSFSFYTLAAGLRDDRVQRSDV